jgi:hypothetical protein
MKKKSLILFSLMFILICCDSIFQSKEANCVVAGSINVIEDYFGDVKFLGEIRNDGDAKALFVKITFTMKDGAENVIGVDFTYVNSTDLDPGQTSSFECYTSVSYSDMDSYTYEISWDDED